ncbi:hypothetical protein [Aeromonas phage AerS_266]|nr:hypothetical protein [Aeromonas phage AerS_266]
MFIQPTFTLTLFNNKQKCIIVNASRNINGDFIFEIDFIDFQYELVFNHKPSRETLINEILQLEIPETSVSATELFIQFCKVAKKNKGAFLLKAFNGINNIRYCYAKNPAFVLKQNVAFVINYDSDLVIRFHFGYRNNKDLVLVQYTKQGTAKGMEFSYGNYTTNTLIQMFKESLSSIDWIDKNKIKSVTNFVESTIQQNQNNLEFMLNRFNNKLKLV